MPFAAEQADYAKDLVFEMPSIVGRAKPDARMAKRRG